MTQPTLPEGTRDLYGNVWHDRFLFVFSATITKPVVYSYANEVHKTGKYVRDPIRWSVIAPDVETAEFAFAQKFRGGMHDSEPQDVTYEAIPISAEMAGLKFR